MNTAREAREEQTQAELPGFVAAVAAALVIANDGDHWWCKPEDPEARTVQAMTLHGPHGAQLIVSMIWNKPERLEVIPLFPRDSRDLLTTADYDHGRKKISVSMDRGAVTVAREITRRILPAYMPVLGKANSAIAGRDGNRAELATMAAFITREHGLSFGHHQRSQDRMSASDWSAHPGLSVSLEIRNDGSDGELTLRGNTSALLAALEAARAVVAARAAR